MNNLLSLLAITDQFISDSRDRIAHQLTLIASLQENGESTEEAGKLLAVFKDIERRLVAYRDTLTDEIAKATRNDT